MADIALVIKIPEEKYKRLLDKKQRYVGMTRYELIIANGTPLEESHWILTMPRGIEEWCYQCSRCGFYKYKKIINLSELNYCPNCGAKMIEQKESEDKI